MSETLRGADSLAAGLDQVAHHLEDWAALTQVADDWRDRAQRRAPHQTGRLASSLRVDNVSGSPEVVSALPYAAVIHNGWAAHNIRANPFLTDTVDPDGAGTLLADDLADALGTIRGA